MRPRAVIQIHSDMHSIKKKKKKKTYRNNKYNLLTLFYTSTHDLQKILKESEP